MGGDRATWERDELSMPMLNPLFRRPAGKAVCLGMILLATGAQAFTQARCSKEEHEIQAAGPWPPIVMSGLAAATAGVASAASGDQSQIALIYLLTVPSLSGLLGFMSMPCLADPSLRRAEPYAERYTTAGTLALVGFNTAVAGSTILFSKNGTSRTIAAVATGLSALSPLLFLGRFQSERARVSVVLGNAIDATVSF